MDKRLLNKDSLHKPLLLLSRRLKSLLFFLLLLFSGATSTLLPSSCSEPEIQQVNPEDTVSYTGPNVKFEQIRTLYSEEAELKIKLEGPLQLVQQNGDVLYPEGIRISMYDEYGIKSTTLTADSGRMNKAEKTYDAFGNVEVINIKREQKVNTEELHWNQRQREIFTDKAIKIVTPTEIINGIGMTSNEQFSKYKIWKTTGIFSVENGNSGGGFGSDAPPKNFDHPKEQEKLPPKEDTSDRNIKKPGSTGHPVFKSKEFGGGNP